MKIIFPADGESPRETYGVSLLAISTDLEADGLKYLELTQDGSLYVLSGSKVEIWQAMRNGSGANNTFWGDYPNGFDFCSSATPSSPHWRNLPETVRKRAKLD